MFRCSSVFASLLVVLSAASGSAAPDAAPEIGDTAPAWDELPGTDGRLHSLKDLQQAEVVVVCFTCNSCPYAVDYEERLVALQKKYTEAGQPVRIVAINSNTIPADRMEEMKKRAAERRFNFPYLQDETQEVAKAYGAIYTPEFYVLNGDREIVYRGAMDDSTDASKVRQRYVEAAVDAALRKTTPEIQKTGARGCTIRFKRRRR